ncbi:MAG: Gfo/Idh/MocA family protein [Janthinobacterium lividum]
MQEDFRVLVIGAGRMGQDHVVRLAQRISGACVAAVVDVDHGRAVLACAAARGAVAPVNLDAALARDDIHGVIVATPGRLHERTLLQVLERDLPILCEKPLTPDTGSAWRVIEAEQRLGRKRIQVGFMRRFDVEYRRLRALVASGELGQAVMFHMTHRNPDTPAGFTNDMLIHDSVVHEFDALRFLAGEEIRSVQVRLGRPTRLAPAGQHDPQQVLIETDSGVLADVEIFVNAQFGYQVGTQTVFEHGVAVIGEEGGMSVRHAGRWGGEVTPGFVERFGKAFDAEVQSWVDAARRGDVGGPDAWDGYAAAACCEAGVAAQRSGKCVPVVLREKPRLYR